MRKSVALACAAAVMTVISCGGNSKMTDMKEQAIMETIFPKGDRAAANFIGEAYVNMLVPKAGDTTYAVGDVIFEAGCRNSWHAHQVRQILLVTAGKGWYRERGKEARPLRSGDVVVIPSGVEHWHGATAVDRFEHVVITDYAGDDCVVWLDPVSDEEYASLPATF